LIVIPAPAFFLTPFVLKAGVFFPKFPNTKGCYQFLSGQAEIPQLINIDICWYFWRWPSFNISGVIKVNPPFIRPFSFGFSDSYAIVYIRAGFCEQAVPIIRFKPTKWMWF
jgi:hypothetical protein